MMKVAVVFLSLFVSVFGQTKYCCAPDQWESKNTFLQGKVDHGTVSVIMGNESLSMDAMNQMVNSDTNISVSTGTTFNLRVLMDYKNRKQYVIQNGVCRASPMTSMPPNCIPDSAVKLESAYFGTGLNKLTFDVYQFTLGPNTHFGNVGPDCTPVFVASYGSLNNVSAVSEKTYANVTVGIKDKSVFDIPASCKHTPVRGPVMDLHRRSIF